jgi:arabinogalactan endo-1,4-beta-galactosidase
VVGLVVNAEKTKYMVMSRVQNVGGSHSIEIDNSSFERVEEFKYLGRNLTNQNSIQEEIKSKLKSGILAIIRCRILCLPVCYPTI